MKLIRSIVQKTFILPLLIIAVMITGCSDDDGGSTNTNPDGNWFLTFKIDGKQYDFSKLVSANDPPSEDTIHFVTISGHESDNLTSPSFGFQLVSAEGAAVGTYTSAESELHGTYSIQNFDDNGNITGTTSYHGDGSDGTGLTLNITALHYGGVEGTFSGVLQLTGGEDYITITEGKFSAPYNYRN